jgi:type IV pilus assembly protein PilC
VAIYKYIALDKLGDRQSGTIDAPSEELSLKKLREEGLTPIEITLVKEPNNVEDILARFREIPSEKLVYFTRQLATMIDSGMTPLRSLAVLEEQEENPRFHEIIGRVISRIEDGTPMWVALEEHPKTFSRLFVAMVRSGEESGSLDSALTELSNQLEKAEKLRKAIRSAILYPKIILSFAFLILSGILIFIIPRFTKIFEDTVAQSAQPAPGQAAPDTSLPLPTEIVVSLSNLLYPMGEKNFAWFLNISARFIILLLLIFMIRRLIRYILSQPGPRTTWDAFKLRAPMKIGPLIQKITVARFARTFSSLLASGISPVQAMEIVADTAGNVLVSSAVLQARQEMLAGSTISEPLARSGAFPAIVVRMIEVGEETGRLEDMLEKIADFFEEEVDISIRGLTALVEPIMILFVGIIIGAVIIAIYLPMFSIYDKIGTGAATIFFYTRQKTLRSYQDDLAK